jgi:capsular polysaccharide transport system permease protein
MAAFTIIPAIAAGLYAGMIATPQYRSEFSFVVRQQAPMISSPSSASSMLTGGNPMLATIEDSQAVVKYIRSYQMLTDLHHRVSLHQFYSQPQIDWFDRLSGRAPLESERRYWRRFVSPSFEMTSGIITVNVRAFSPSAAHKIADAILMESESLVNRMSDQARQSAVAYAERVAHQQKLKLLSDEMKLAAYRNRHTILFPQMTASANTSVASQLSSKLAQDRATLQSLEDEGQGGGSTQIAILKSKIKAMQSQVGEVTGAMATDGASGGKSLATILTGYDDLKIREKLDLKLYTSDIESLQAARNRANQKQIYLESIVSPNMPQVSTYPIAWMWTAEAAMIGFFSWLILSVLASAITDHLD